MLKNEKLLARPGGTHDILQKNVFIPFYTIFNYFSNNSFFTLNFQASIIFVRGKKRIGYDISVTAEWKGIFFDVF